MSRKTPKNRSKELLESLEGRPFDLEKESNEWAPAQGTEDATPVTFVADPFGLSLDEVAEAQLQEDADLDDDLADDELSEEELEMDEFEDESEEESSIIDMAQLRASSSAADDSEANDSEEESALSLENDVADWAVDEEAEQGGDDDALEPELDLEKSLSLDSLQNVAAAIAIEEEKEAIEMAERLAEQKVEDEARLAAEIAEDEALAAELARQDAEGSETDPELLAALPSLPVADENGVLDLREVESCIEALLFMSDKPMSEKRLRELLGPDFGDEIFAQALASLQERYQSPAHGIELAQVSGGWQLRTKPGRAALARKLAKVQTQRLSSGGMETLAIIAYKQPVLKDEIDTIRGVDSSHFIRGLLDKKLIQITGRSELPGRPMLYATTPEFLELFGLASLEAMPSLRELEQMVPASQTKDPSEEDPRVREMRKLVGQMKADHSTSLIYDPKEDEKLLQEIRERVQDIPSSTPYLDEQKAQEKAAKDAAKAAAQAAEAAGQDAAQLAAEAAMAAVEPGTTPLLV
jgi:segregation and condensation protein B